MGFQIQPASHLYRRIPNLLYLLLADDDYGAGRRTSLVRFRVRQPPVSEEKNADNGLTDWSDSASCFPLQSRNMSTSSYCTQPGRRVSLLSLTGQIPNHKHYLHVISADIQTGQTTASYLGTLTSTFPCLLREWRPSHCVHADQTAAASPCANNNCRSCRAGNSGSSRRLHQPISRPRRYRCSSSSQPSK